MIGMTTRGTAGVAAEVLDGVATLATSAKRTIPAGTYSVVRARMAQLLGIDDASYSPETGARVDESELSAWTTSSRSSVVDRACLRMAEQFVGDVSAVTDEQRTELGDALGDGAPILVTVLHAIEVELRLRTVGRQLFGTDPLDSAAPEAGLGLPDALNRVTWRITRLDALDPLVTELVRLRGARIHDCRRCTVLRHVDALASGGDEEMFRSVDYYESSDLTERQKVALRLTDAVLMRPAKVPAKVVAQVNEHFNRAEALEIVLDVERNARNKIAVANGTDGDGAGEGLAIYDTPDGGFELVSNGIVPGAPRGRL